jgi:hypothetical protein
VEGLEELRDWLKANPNEVVLLYIERKLDGHEPRLTSLLNEYLDEFIFKPSTVRKSNENAKSCVYLPSETLTKADVLKAHKQLLIVTKGCDGANPDYEEQDEYPFIWNNYVFAGIGELQNELYTFLDSTYDENVKAYPDCADTSIFENDPKHHSMWRLYDDLTTLSNLGSPPHKISVEDMQNMVRCNINWQAMDMLEINDERLAATIWSWAKDYPKTGQGHCAVYQQNKGFENRDCDILLPAFACHQTGTEHWKVIITAGKNADGEKICQTIAGASWHFAVPVNGKEMVLLTQASNNMPEIALNYKEIATNQWQANV